MDHTVRLVDDPVPTRRSMRRAIIEIRRRRIDRVGIRCGTSDVVSIMTTMRAKSVVIACLATLPTRVLGELVQTHFWGDLGWKVSTVLAGMGGIGVGFMVVV